MELNKDWKMSTAVTLNESKALAIEFHLSFIFKLWKSAIVKRQTCLSNSKLGKNLDLIYNQIGAQQMPQKR